MKTKTTVGGRWSGGADGGDLPRARRPRRFTVYEKSHLGGRARTVTQHGALFNEGPHALYCAGRALQVLRELGIEPKGGVPPPSGSLAWYRGQLHALPVGVVSLLSTSLLPAADKLAVVPVLATVGRIDTAALDARPLGGWIEKTVHGEPARDFLRSLFRVSTYANDLSMSAGAALRQLQLALKANVLYVDGGWQVLVDAPSARRRWRPACASSSTSASRSCPRGKWFLAVSPKEVSATDRRRRST